MTPRVRLAVLVVTITALPVALWLWQPVSVPALRSWVEGYGPLAPLAFLVVSVLLGAALFPGPVLAGASGLLFGAGVGTLVTVAGAVLTALVSRELGARAGRAGAVEVLGRRAAAVGQAGVETVLVQRLAPGLPDGPFSYAFGALGVTRRATAVGTALGTLPRAFSYTAIGASLDDPGSALSWAGWAGALLSAVVGVLAARRLHRRRRAQASSRTVPPSCSRSSAIAASSPPPPMRSPDGLSGSSGSISSPGASPS